MNKFKDMQKELNKKDKEIEQLKADKNVKHHHKLRKKNNNLALKIVELTSDVFELKKDLAKCLKKNEELFYTRDEIKRLTKLLKTKGLLKDV